MKCGICGSDDTEVIYDDVVRNGGIGKYTDEKYQMYQCQACGTIFHKLDEAKSDAYYQSTEYRLEMNETADVDGYDRLHDGEVLEKLEYTGTDIYRNKIVADIGCGGGSFLDFVAGAAKEIVAIEPSASFRKALSTKGYRAYPYASDAMHDFAGKVDVVTSFDVIEHVNDPAEFMKDVHALLSKENNRPGGVAIIGTPSDCPFMRMLLGKVYEQRVLFSYQHPWILSAKSLELCCRRAGFTDVRIETKQRYDLANAIRWCIEKKPTGHAKLSCVTPAMSEVYRKELEQQGMGDYLVAYVRK